MSTSRAWIASSASFTLLPGALTAAPITLPGTGGGPTIAVVRRCDRRRRLGGAASRRLDARLRAPRVGGRAEPGARRCDRGDARRRARAARPTARRSASPMTRARRGSPSARPSAAFSRVVVTQLLGDELQAPEFADSLGRRCRDELRARPEPRDQRQWRRVAGERAVTDPQPGGRRARSGGRPPRLDRRRCRQRYARQRRARSARRALSQRQGRRRLHAERRRARRRAVRARGAERARWRCRARRSGRS